jgi:A118 family predicted phage portal protein
MLNKLANQMYKLRRWMGMIFSKNKKIQDIVKTQISAEHYDMIDKWKSIYGGTYEEFNKLKYNTVMGQKTRRRQSLGMGKVVSQELAKLVFSEKVEININNKQFADNIEDAFQKNRFYKVFQSKVEQMFALGGLVLKAHPKEQLDGSYKLAFTYVTPDCFIPISYDNEEITEGAFVTVTKKGDKTYYLFEIHQWDNRKSEDSEDVKHVYVIQNELYEEDTHSANSNSPLAKQVPLDTLYEGLEPEVTIENLTNPLFQYIKPNLANNFDLQSPLGISIFANSIDTLNAIDVAFDSYVREFKLGRRRIIVPASAVRTTVDPETGEFQRYFDAEDEVYQAFNFSDAEKQQIKDNTVALRVDEHIGAINSLLNLLAMQVGFSPGTFTFDGQSVKTATEVITENSKTYQTKQINEQVLEEALSKFIHTLGEVADLYDIFPMPSEEIEVEFNWDDSILKDKETDSNFFIKLKNAGLITASFTLQQILDFTEEQADEMIKQVQEENKAMNPDMDNMFGGAE